MSVAPSLDALCQTLVEATKAGDMAAAIAAAHRLGWANAVAVQNDARRRGGQASAARRQSEAMERMTAWQEMAAGYWRTNPTLSAARVAELIVTALQKGGPGVLADVDTIRKAIRNPNRR